MSSRSSPAPFLTKTYQLVEDSNLNDIISWSDSGSSFVVWKPTEFARDLLPNYFKHNNFSSFVRQLNTYGFRKLVPDRWEFSNEFFRRGERPLLCEIHRRKPPNHAAAVGKANITPLSTSNSNDDNGSTAASSPLPTETQPAHQFADLSDENEKLRKDNEMLALELAKTKRQCEELVAFLSRYVDQEEIDLLISGEDIEQGEEEDEACTDTDEEAGEKPECLKLFGVWLGEGPQKKRKRCAEMTDDALLDFKSGLQEPWMKIVVGSSPGESSKV